MTQIINGRKIKNEMLQDIKEKVQKLDFVPIFCDILVGDDPSSLQYVQMKAKTAESVGIKFREAFFKAESTTEEVINAIENLNKVPHMCGIIVQLPLPSHIDKERVLNSVDVELDVDCLNIKNSTNFYNGEALHGFPTALACMKVFDYAIEKLENLRQDVASKKIVVLGQGVLVGRPVTHLLRERGLTVDVINSQTENKISLIKEADVLISAIGQGKYITGSMIKEGVVIIDAGTSEENSSIVGDVDFDSVSNIASCISPVPGGVGPITVATLIQNVLLVAERKSKLKNKNGHINL